MYWLMIQLELAATLLGAILLSACVSYWLIKRNNEQTAEILKDKLLEIHASIEEALNEALGPFLPLIKRSMTLASNAGAQANKVKAVEREIIRAVQEDLPVTPEMITAFSPRLGEMLEENPELLPKAYSFLKQFIGDSQGNVLETASRRHPLGGKEE